MLVMSSETDFAAAFPPSGNDDQGASRKAQAMVAFNPWRSPSAMIGLMTSTAPARIKASRDSGHCARLRMTKREKSSSEFDVQRDGGAVAARMFSTTHRGISVCPIKAAFSSLLAKFLMRPQAHRTPSDLPLLALGGEGELVRSFSKTRRSEWEFSRGEISLPSGVGECCRMVVMLASKKERFMRQMQHKYDSCLSSAMTLQRPPMTSFEAGPRAMTRLFSVGIDKLFKARQAK
mmetsp:Transcript_54305/g.131772  ORF Transcript_54305/g.131772 Transcript_54305/m.131772 type:complete len:234 (-) Transcript_54305:639-1340(-)